MTGTSLFRPGRRARALIPLLALLAVLLEPLSGTGQNPLRGRRLYVAPNTPARKQADQWARSRPQDAARMRRIADQPLAIWLGDWSPDIRREVDGIMAQAGGAVPIFVVYNIPNRDCGLHSAGGARGGDAYRRWVRALADGLRRRPSVVILEPDGLPAIDCLP